jgi:hypothetical protein
MANLFNPGICASPTEGPRFAGQVLTVVALVSGIFAATSVRAQLEAPVVDLELILAVDVSPSMSEVEQRVQRDGYVSAFRSPDVARAIELGPHRMIAVSYIEWAGPGYQRIVMPWTIIGDYDDAKRFADALAIQPILREPGTSISAGLLRAENLLAHSRSTSHRRVIDVSGDGPNNSGPLVEPVRDKLVASGVSINGLPISLHHGYSNTFESFDAGFLESYYEHCVIGGSDAFVIGIEDISQFEVAIHRKLVREIAGHSTHASLASYRPQIATVVDCSAVGQAPGR